MEKNSKLNFKGQDIYVGLDTGKKSWKVAILTRDYEHKTFSQPPEPKDSSETSESNSLCYICYEEPATLFSKHCW